MIRLTAADIAEACSVDSPAQGAVTGLAIDSRAVRTGDLFVALPGSNTDGARYVEAAHAAGAPLALIAGDGDPTRDITVPDPLIALGQVAAMVRQRSRASVVGITGSTGKTSTKDILAALCARVGRTVASPANHNTEIGVPLTLGMIEPDTEIAICELAMRGLGQIAYLAEICRPDVAVITGVGPAHLELLGTIEKVAEAKAEILDSLGPDGTAVVPFGEPLLDPYLSLSRSRVVTFGDAAGADVRLTDFVSGRAEFSVFGRTLQVPVSFTQRHNAINLAAALGACHGLGVPLDEAAEGAVDVAFSAWRGEQIELEGGGILIADCYNANPTSMEAALRHLVQVAGDRRAVAVIGDMAELGEAAGHYHEQIGALAHDLGIDVIAVGPLARGYGGRWFDTVQSLMAGLAEAVDPHDALLVKASRSMGLEAVVEALVPVKDVLGAAVIALLLGIIAGPAFIAFLRRNEFGQQIREEGPAGHQSKQGTPTMGGLVLIGCALIAFAIFSKHTTTGWTVAAVTVACAAIGFADDFLKLRRRRSLGLSGRVKMLLLAVIAAALGLVVHNENLGTDVYVPLVNIHLAMGPFYYLFLFLVVAGATNAVNLTDGLDGLAAGTTTIALAAYSAIMLVAFLVTQSPGHHALRAPGDHVSLDLAIMSAALVGGAVGFLWYNAYPADVFMGDTGSFGLGGALAAMAVFTKTEFLLVVIGGIFVIEALSVLIQVVAFKTTGKRVFLMAPIHHHFEMMEWTENKIIVRFWIAASIFGASGFVLYYLYFSSYR